MTTIYTTTEEDYGPVMTKSYILMNEVTYDYLLGKCALSTRKPGVLYIVASGPSSAMTIV